MKICPHCNAKQEDEVRICAYCGSELWMPQMTYAAYRDQQQVPNPNFTFEQQPQRGPARTATKPSGLSGISKYCPPVGVAILIVSAVLITFLTLVLSLAGDGDYMSGWIWLAVTIFLPLMYGIPAILVESVVLWLVFRAISAKKGQEKTSPIAILSYAFIGIGALLASLIIMLYLFFKFSPFRELIFHLAR